MQDMGGIQREKRLLFQSTTPKFYSFGALGNGTFHYKFYEKGKLG
jgi:hypothetical protein